MGCGKVLARARARETDGIVKSRLYERVLKPGSGNCGLCGGAAVIFQWRRDSPPSLSLVFLYGSLSLYTPPLRRDNSLVCMLHWVYE